MPGGEEGMRRVVEIVGSVADALETNRRLRREAAEAAALEKQAKEVGVGEVACLSRRSGRVMLVSPRSMTGFCVARLCRRRHVARKS